jgi:hypothetical protein
MGKGERPRGASRGSRGSAVEVCQWHAVTGLTSVDADLIAVERSVERGSWNDLATAGRPGFLNSKAGEALSTSPRYMPRFFLHRTCGRVSTPYCIDFFAREIYAPAQGG